MAPNCTVPLPSGSLMVAFKGDDNKAKVSDVKAGSPMYGKFKVGYTFLELRLGDGTIMTGLDTGELVSALSESSNDNQRVMKLEMSLPAESTIILFGLQKNRRHGLIIEDRFDKRAILTRTTADCPLKREVRVGMVVDTVIFSSSDENEYEMTGYSAKDINDALDDDAAGTTTRITLVLKDPSIPGNLSSRQTTTGNHHSPGKIMLPLHGSLKDMGITVSGTPASIAEVDTMSSLKGSVLPGFTVKQYGYSNGTEFEGLGAYELEEIIEDSSGSPGRYLLLESSGGSKSYPSYNGGFPVQQQQHNDDVVECTLPAGKLNAVFIGNPARVVRINPGSPLEKMGIRPNMLVDSLIINRKRLGSMNTKDFTNALKNSINEENRKVRFVSIKQTTANTTTAMLPTLIEGENEGELPNELEVVLPTGKLGCVFSGNPPTVKTFRDKSPVAASFPPGMYVDRFQTRDGFRQSNMTSRELVDLLNEYIEEEGRLLVLRNNTQPSSIRETILPEEKTITIPTGKLGLSFKGRNLARITRVHDDSNLMGKVYRGMIVDSITIPGSGSTFSGMTAKEAARILKDTKNIGGRSMTLKNPTSSNLSVRSIQTDDVSIGSQTSQNMSAGWSAQSVRM